MVKTKIHVLLCLLLLTFCVTACTVPATPSMTEETVYTVDTVPVFDGVPFVAINGNVPTFTTAELVTKGYETYAPLDLLGRCGKAVACVGKEMMPTEERGSIGSVKPSGWQTVKYDIVEGKYLYNRCHLIGYQLTGENANEQNLITGTRYLNVDGMLPFENMVADYVKETGNHVMYRVTPIYDGVNLVARGVQMEAKSVEDDGEGVSFNVYVYNAQPGVVINYLNGESALQGSTTTVVTTQAGASQQQYVLNISSKKIHLPTCDALKTTKEENKRTTNEAKDVLIADGYTACKSCNP